MAAERIKVTENMYIDFNTQKELKRKNAFVKDVFKLMNNSVFGKTMENIRKRVDVRFATDKNKLLASKYIMYFEGKFSS